MAGAGPTLDGSRRQHVEIEGVAEHLQEAEFLLLDMEIGRRDLDGEGVGGLVEFLRQRRGDERQHRVEAVVVLEERPQVSAAGTSFSRSKSLKTGSVWTISPIFISSRSVIVRSAAESVTMA